MDVQKVKFFKGLSDDSLARQYLDLCAYDTYSANEDRLICGKVIIDRFLEKNIYSDPTFLEYVSAGSDS